MTTTTTHLGPRLGAAAAALGLLGPLGCEQPCAQDVRAQVLDERVRIEIGDEVVQAEVADDPVERERGWRHRRCGREALLLVPDQRGELPIWGCELAAPVDLHFIRDGAVEQVARGLEPCAAPCTRCPTEGLGLAVDAVLETPAGSLVAERGEPVRGLP